MVVVVVDFGLRVWWLWVEERVKKKIERQRQREVVGLVVVG